MLRFDTAKIDKAERTKEGFLVFDAIVTRTGVFTYLNADGSLRKEYRSPDEVFNKDSLKSMEMLPLTLLHPSEKTVTADNAKQLSVGFTGQDVNHDEKYVKTKIKVTDQKAIDNIENGMQELSLGYSVDLVKEDGETDDGYKYDAKQTNIFYNHLAIVPRARAGREARIVLDGDDAIQQLDDQTKKPKTKPKEDSKMTVKVTLDSGIQYDAAPEVKVALEGAIKRADTAEKALQTAKDGNSALQAKYDAASEELKTLKKVDHSAEIKKAVHARLSLERAASEHLDKETIEKFDSMDDKAIKVAVIKKYSPEVNLDGKNDIYLDARYDAAIENKPESKSMSDQNVSMHKPAKNDTGRKDSKSARDTYIENLLNSSKPKESK